MDSNWIWIRPQTRNPSTEVSEVTMVSNWCKGDQDQALDVLLIFCCSGHLPQQPGLDLQDAALIHLAHLSLQSSHTIGNLFVPLESPAACRFQNDYMSEQHLQKAVLSDAGCPEFSIPLECQKASKICISFRLTSKNTDTFIIMNIKTQWENPEHRKRCAYRCSSNKTSSFSFPIGPSCQSKLKTQKQASHCKFGEVFLISWQTCFIWQTVNRAKHQHHIEQ